MLLSEFVGKRIYVDEIPRGICLGIGLSLKNKNLKYLLCSTNELSSQPDFVISITALYSITSNALTLTHLRPVFPKNYAKLFLNVPVYDANGNLLGKVCDATIKNHILTTLQTDKTEFPFSVVTATADAVILRKKSPFPLGQPLFLNNEKSPVVTKSVLRRAIEKRSLIKLTLSLSPFQHKL